jgi:hypothetical protein
VFVVAVKLPVVEPLGTVTDAGTGSAPVLLERLTVTPAEEAGSLSAAVQIDEAPLLSDAGLQESPANVGARTSGAGSVIVPPVPVTEIGLPAAVAPARLVRPIGVVPAELVIVTLITATTPFWMTASFIPDSRHV